MYQFSRGKYDRSFASWRDQQGFSRLESAIVFAAFVALSAGFVYFVLTAGILTAEGSRTAVLGALHQTTGQLALNGQPTGKPTSDRTGLDRLRFQAINISPSSVGVDVSNEFANVRYIDGNQLEIIASSDWTATWQIGSGITLDRGEIVEISVDLRGLGIALGPSQEFTLELLPNQGTGLSFTRTTPRRFDDVVVLR